MQSKYKQKLILAVAVVIVVAGFAMIPLAKRSILWIYYKTQWFFNVFRIQSKYKLKLIPLLLLV